MLRFLTDPANVITSLGLVLSALAIHATVSGRPDLGVAIALWAMLADHLDGVVASRTPNRCVDTAKMGKSLDGFADLVYGAVFPAVLLLEIGGGTLLSLAVASLLLIAGALRLSYFSNFGLSTDGRFTGVPLSYDVPVLAVLFLLRSWLPEEDFALFLSGTLLCLAVLHVAPLRVPAARGLGYVAIVVFSVASSLLLVLAEPVA